MGETVTSKGLAVLKDMIRNPGRVYKLDKSIPGSPFFNAYRMTADLKLESWYTGCRGWTLTAYSDDWNSFVSHLGEKLVIVGDEEAAKMV